MELCGRGVSNFFDLYEFCVCIWERGGGSVLTLLAFTWLCRRGMGFKGLWCV